MAYRHTLQLQRTKKKLGSAGQSEREPDGALLPIRGNYHPLDADEILLWGDSARETGKWFCKAWPGDIYSSITYDGGTWDQVAPAKVFGLGSGTRHVEVVIRRR